MNEADRSAYKKALQSALATIEIELPARGVEQLMQHFELVVETNRKFNLTRITLPTEFAVKHHVDSLAIVAWLRDTDANVSRFLDIGTGAGVPAVPLAVALPDSHVCAMDGTGKKARFVEEIARTLDLANLSAVHARAEHWKADRPFDVVCFKAIGPLDRCLRLAAPHVERGGFVIAYKTADLDEAERVAGTGTARELGFATPELFAYELDCGEERLRRALWIFRRNAIRSDRRPRRARRN